MRIEASLEEWRELYNVAIEIHKIKPWTKLSVLDLITIFLKGQEEPCLCSVMGQLGERYGVYMYIGDEAITDFFQLINSSDMPHNQIIRYQNSVICHFGSREELVKEEREIIKKLGIKFRGKNNWIYFRVNEKGYSPYMPDKDQVLMITEILKNLYMAIGALNEGLNVRFKQGKALFRVFNEERDLWLNFEDNTYVPRERYMVAEIDDELFLKRLNKQPRTNNILELDVIYLSTFMRSKILEKMSLMKLALVVDGETGELFRNEIVTLEDNEMDILFRCLIDYITIIGIPKIILVRDIYTNNVLSDICSKLNIEMHISSTLYSIDRFAGAFDQIR
ncbi:hypothetical protein Z968_05420 [Clostridium novyi A str. 4552]|uniref:Uncharacterized protein n=1 Tax=Clostridium novyi A str. 4552 TaxID=1444289 RepID=A0A0A0I8A6_CLONO|nr:MULTISPECIES: hypothetical protein [Clostridium]KEH98502.1 hypothetical protein Z962_11965 [Clostridium botulinum C/D str. BKT12695]KGM96768.1 hypothetical protein Z968_05420 [Clostridium novyi A str. 4552]